jgi:hypothetical protein
MEFGGDTSETDPRAQQILEQMLGRELSPDEEHMPVNLHITVEDIDPYLDWASQFDFIKVIEPRTRMMGGWEAAVIFPEGQTLTFWQERWPEEAGLDGQSVEL